MTQQLKLDYRNGKHTYIGSNLTISSFIRVIYCNEGGQFVYGLPNNILLCGKDREKSIYVPKELLDKLGCAERIYGCVHPIGTLSISTRVYCDRRFYFMMNLVRSCV